MKQAVHGGRLDEASKRFGIPREAFIDFSSNINGFAPPILQKDWEKWKEEVARYPDITTDSLRERLSTIYKVSSGHMIPTSGGIEALYLSARLFYGKRILILEPGFGDYHRAFSVAGGKISQCLKMWNESLWKEKMEEADVIVLGNPNNPTGHLLPRKELLELLSSKPSKIWVIDEAFMEFVPDANKETLLNVLEQFPNLIILRSLTKSWAIPGLRLGFVATSQANWLNQIIAMQPPWSINGIAQAWAQTYLTLENFSLLKKGLAELRNAREKFVKALSLIEEIKVHPSNTNFLLLELKEEANFSTSFLEEELGKRGILIRLCDSFFGLPQGRYIRVAVRKSVENTAFIKTWREMVKIQSSDRNLTATFIP